MQTLLSAWELALALDAGGAGGLPGAQCGFALLRAIVRGLTSRVVTLHPCPGSRNPAYYAICPTVGFRV